MWHRENKVMSTFYQCAAREHLQETEGEFRWLAAKIKEKEMWWIHLRFSQNTFKKLL